MLSAELGALLLKTVSICFPPLLFLIEKLWFKAEMKDSHCSSFTGKKLMLFMTLKSFFKIQEKTGKVLGYSTAVNSCLSALLQFVYLHFSSCCDF